MTRDRIAENVGCRFLVTDAKSEAVSFYEKQGFVLLDSEGNQSAENTVDVFGFNDCLIHTVEI